MQDNLDNYQLARDRTRRGPHSLVQDARVVQRANNEKRSYAQIVRTRSQASGNDAVAARVVIEPPIRAHSSNRNTGNANARNAGADSHLEHIAVRDGNDLRRYVETGQMSLLTLRNLARGPRTPSPPSPGLANPVDHVYTSDPEAPRADMVVPAAGSTPVPTAGSAPVPAAESAPIPASTRPIATTYQGRNAWPGITIGHQPGDVVRSRFAGEGHASRGPRNVSAAYNPAPPLRRTDIDTIVPGTPLPQRPLNQVLSQCVPNSNVVNQGSTNVARDTATHLQTNLVRVAASQPLPPPATVHSMTPPGPRAHKVIRHPVGDGNPASQPSSASIVTPTPIAGTGMVATSTSHNHVHGNTVRAHAVRTGFNFSNANLSSNASAPVHYKMQATRKPNGQPGRPIPFPTPPPYAYNYRMPQPTASPGHNPFFVPHGQDALRELMAAERPMPVVHGLPEVTRNDVPAHVQAAQLERSARSAPVVFRPPPAPSMADRPMPVYQNTQGVVRNDVPASQQAALYAQSAQFAALRVPPDIASQPYATVPHSQDTLAQPPLPPSQPPISSYAQAQVPLPPSVGQAAHFPVAQNPPVPQPAPAQQASGPQAVHAPAAQFLPQQQPAVQQAYLGRALPPFAPLFNNAQVLPQAPFGPASPMDVDDEGDVLGEGDIIGVGMGGAPPPGADPNLNLARPSTISNYPHEVQPVMRTYVRYFRVWNFATGSYRYVSPNPLDNTPTHDDMALQCWVWANEEHNALIPFDPEYMKPADAAVGAARSLAKSHLVSVVHHYFGFRVGETEHNKELKEYLLPDRIHYGLPDEQRRPMESEFLQEAARAVAFQSTNSIGFRSRSYFAPPKDRFLAFLCTLTHHIVYCYRHGDYQYEKLCAAQQEATFGNYMRLIEWTRTRTPNLLYNARVGIYDYCLRSLVDPDPELEEEEEDREWSADAEEIVTSQYASHFPAPAQPAPAATAQVQPAFATPAMAQPEPTEPTEQSPVGHSSVTSGEGVRWEIITHADGNVFLVGPDDAIQINPKIVDDLLNFRISPSSVLEIALQASFSPIQEIPGGVVTDDVFDGAFAAKLALEECSQAGPSGLTAEEKDDAAVAGATIMEVSDGEEELPPGRNKGKGKASTLYGGRYLDDYGGVEPGEDEAYVGIEGSEDFEPAEISDEEMELEKDD